MDAQPTTHMDQQSSLWSTAVNSTSVCLQKNDCHIPRNVIVSHQAIQLDVLEAAGKDCSVKEEEKEDGWVDDCIVYICKYVCMFVGTQEGNLGETTQKSLRQQQVQKYALSPGRQESVIKRQNGSPRNSLGYKWEGREATG